MNYNNSYIFVKTEKETKNPRNSHDSFFYFMKNSFIEMLSDSSAYAFVLKCTFKKEENMSPYFYMNSKGEIENVLIIAVKTLLVVDANEHPDKVKWNYLNKKSKISLRHYETKNNFFDEVEKQHAVSKLSIEHLNRNSPVILFSKLFTHQSVNKKTLKKTILKNCSDNVVKTAIGQMFSELKRIQTDASREHYYGIIAMEYITPNYKTFCDIIKPIIIDEIIANPENSHIHKYDSLSLAPKSNRLRWAYNTARYDVLRMAIDTGYSEGDFHTDNILIDEHRRQAILLDFGKATKIPLTIENIFDYAENKTDGLFVDEFHKKLQFAFKTIFETNFSDEQENSAEFKWLKNIDIEDTNIILFLDKLRNSTMGNETTANSYFDFYFQNPGYVFSDNYSVDYITKKWYWFP